MLDESDKKRLQNVISKIQSLPDLSKVSESPEDECELLDDFVKRFMNEYNFSDFGCTPQTETGELCRPSTQGNLFLQLFYALLDFRFLDGKWQQIPSTNHRLVVLICLRLLMRDSSFQRRFLLRGGRDELVTIFDGEGRAHYQGTEILREGQYPLIHIASMLSKMDADVLMHCHKTACYLLSTPDPYLLQCILVTLKTLAQSEAILVRECQGLLHLPAGDGAVETVEKLLDIVKAQPKQEFRQLGAEIIYNLSVSSEENRAIIMENDANTIFLGLLNEEAVLLEQTLRILENQANIPESSRQIRTLGGIDRVLNMLQTRCMETSDVRTSGDAASSENIIIAGCDLLTQLAFDDDNSLHIRQMNGVHTLANILLHGCPRPPPAAQSESEHYPPQAYALRTLRFVFSLERNRKAFKRLFPSPALFELFIDIGQYERDMSKYAPLARELASLSSEKRALMLSAVSAMLDKDGVKTVRRYVLLGDAIGKGGFGTIYRCRREGNPDVHYALKEIPLREPGGFMPAAAAAAAVGEDAETHREVSLLQQMDHPNIVRYIESFTERDRETGCPCLYIVMELVEGTSLLELINSHAEKKQRIPERKIREIAVQVLHALYYMHRKKKVTHRDLTPSNILLRTEEDVLTQEAVLRPVLVDFGLARQRQSEHSVMASVVGTLTYSCPELIERRPYTDKADVWSLGVILYQLVCLRNPFADSNPLQVARRIVEGDFRPMEDPDGHYSPGLKALVAKLMRPSTAARPDVVQALEETAAWGRPDPAGPGDGGAVVDRADELYLRTRRLEEQVRALQGEKDRLEAKARQLHRDSLSRGGPFAASPRRGPWAAAAAGWGDVGDVLATPTKPRPHAPIQPYTPGRARGPGPALLPQTPTAGKPPRSRAASIRVPADQVKEMDPVTQLLNQLHKIIFVTQLPPDMAERPDHARFRRAVERYKRALFVRRAAGQGQGLRLKQELYKLMTSSADTILLDFSGADGPPAGGAAGPGGRSTSPEGKGARWGVTYAQMVQMLEELLARHGYYAPDPAGPDSP